MHGRVIVSLGCLVNKDPSRRSKSQLSGGLRALCGFACEALPLTIRNCPSCCSLCAPKRGLLTPTEASRRCNPNLATFASGRHTDRSGFRALRFAPEWLASGPSVPMRGTVGLPSTLTDWFLNRRYRWNCPGSVGRWCAGRLARRCPGLSGASARSDLPVGMRSDLPAGARSDLHANMRANRAANARLCSPREVLFMEARDRQSVYNESRPLSAYEIPARNDIAQLHDAPGPRGMLVPLKRLGIIFF